MTIKKSSFQHRNPTEQRERAKRMRIERERRFRAQLEQDGLFACVSHIVTADGSPSESKVKHAERFLSSRESPDSRPSSVSAERLSAITRETVFRRVSSYVAGCSPRVNERRDLLEELLDLAGCEGPLSPSAVDAVREIAQLLELPSDKYGKLLQRWVSGRNEGADSRRSRRSRSNERREHVVPPAVSLIRHYEVLGCRATDSDRTVKQRYRELVAIHHPDKHPHGSDSSESGVNHLDRFREVQEAYEAVTEARRTEE